MAVVSASNVRFFSFTTPGGPVRNTAGAQVESCFMSAEFTGTYAQADNAIISAVPTLLAAVRRDGLTATLVDAAFVAPGTEGASTLIGAKTVTVSTADITCELTTGDLSTEHAGAALTALSRPIIFFITYTLA